MREEKKFFFFCNKKKLLARLILYHHFYQFTRNFDLISNVPPMKPSLNWWLIFEYDLITTDLAKKTESCGVSYSFSLENPLISLLQLLILLYNSSYMTPLDIFIENMYPTINYYLFANFNFEVDISLSCMKISQFFFSPPHIKNHVVFYCTASKKKEAPKITGRDMPKPNLSFTTCLERTMKWITTLLQQQKHHSKPHFKLFNPRSYFFGWIVFI